MMTTEEWNDKPTGTQALTDEELLERLLADEAALQARIEELVKERERLALAICGGEDAVGYANAQPVEVLEKVARNNAAMTTWQIDKTMQAEAKLAKAVEALRFYGNEDNYKSYAAVDPCGCCSSWYEPKIHIDGEDSGGVARAVLAELEGQP